MDEQKIIECFNSICGLMFEYGRYWIYHLDEIGADVDTENATRERYGLWNNCFDPDAFLEAYGW